MTNFVSIEDFYSSNISCGQRSWHLWTPENHQVLFTSERDYKIGMDLIAISALLHPDVRVLTFELMSNHVHMTLIGREAAVHDLFNTFKKYLARHFEHQHYYVDLSNFLCFLRELRSVAEVRDVISYNNRNGFVVNPDTTPFSYRWGANRFFFNPDAKLRYAKDATKMTIRQRRELTHGRAADALGSVMMLDGYACPMCFCDIKTAELFFRNASDFLYCISRNVESAKKIAEECGERVFYTDGELFRIICTLAAAKSKGISPGLLPKEAKVEIARTLHYDYNADNKKIARLLKLDIHILNGMFTSRNS